jgi:hypothetical protein
MRACLPFAILLLVVASGAQALNRSGDPVVFTGADIPSLVGIAPTDLVAFSYDGRWQQIPVQVDERAVIDFVAVMNQGTGGLTRLDYTDPDTFTGPDPDPLLDADDEIVFMAGDAGQKPAQFSEPAGVVAQTGVEVTVFDPLGSTGGYVYLFEQDGSLDQAAGQDYVDYDFNLLSGDYKATYKTAAGPNPEDTVVTTDYYQVHFQDRWVQDGLRIYAGTATGADILDMHNNQFSPSNGARTVVTFSLGEGAFIVNKDGPVRAIRSYIGANSGPWTQRQHIYYAQREDIVTFLRVHAIGGIMDFMDYSPDAAGMTYHNNHNLSGVTIDGVPDTVGAGTIEWELTAGAQGSLIIASRVDTDIPDPSSTSYYLDDSTPPVTQYTGDAYAYGSSGMWMDHSIPNTDPFGTPPVYHLAYVQSHYYGPPGLTVADAEERKSWVEHPIATSFTPFTQSGLAGQVRVRGTTTDIQGATVEAYLGAELKATAPTNAYGVYQISDLPDGQYVVAAHKQGYVSQTKAKIAVTTGQITYVNFSLEVSGRITGQVRERGTTNDLVGATVTAYLDGKAQASATTDKYGVYVIDADLPAGTYTVLAAMAGYVTQTKGPIAVTAGATSYVNFGLERTPSIKGQVREAGTGTPIAGATVSINSWGLLTVVVTATSDANGIYVFPPGLPSGTYILWASKTGYVTQTKANISTIEGETRYVNFNLQVSGKLKGQVRDKITGAAIIGATVIARSGGILRATATTIAPWGIYEIDRDLPSGTYVTEASKAGYLAQMKKDIVVTAGATTYVNFNLAPGG